MQVKETIGNANHLLARHQGPPTQRGKLHSCMKRGQRYSYLYQTFISLKARDGDCTSQHVCACIYVSSLQNFFVYVRVLQNVCCSGSYVVTLNGITDLSIMGHTSCPNLRLSLVINSDWAQNQLAKLRVIELGVLGKKKERKECQEIQL